LPRPLSYEPYFLCAWLDQSPRLSGLELMLYYFAFKKNYLIPAQGDEEEIHVRSASPKGFKFYDILIIRSI